MARVYAMLSPSALLPSCPLALPQAKGRTGEAIGRLCQLAPPTALLLELDPSTGAEAGEREVPTSLLHRGDLLKVGRQALDCLSLQAVECRMLLAVACRVLPATGQRAVHGCPRPLAFACASKAWLHALVGLRRGQTGAQALAVPASHRPCAVWARRSRPCPVQVLPGARIPTDGVVEVGSSHVDESMLTGESGGLRVHPEAAMLLAPLAVHFSCQLTSELCSERRSSRTL